MRNNRLAGPNRTRFPRGVAERDNEVEDRIVEVCPRLAIGIRDVDLEIFAKNLQRERMRRGFRIRSCAVAFEARWGDLFQKVFREDAPRGISGAKKQNPETRFVGIHRG